MLKLKNIKTDYYGCEVLIPDLQFNKGITLILGETGSYKTTLFRIIGGVKEIKEGSIELDGNRIEELPPKKRDMALVGMDTIPHDKVKKALMAPLIFRGVKKEEAASRAEKFGSRLPLDLRCDALDKEKLLEFFDARLSLRDTLVTMFDEPYHLLGEQNFESINRMICSRTGYVIVSSCDGSDAERLKPSDIVILRRGELVQCGSYDEVKVAPANKYVEKFLNM